MDLDPAMKGNAWTAIRMRTMTRSDLIATITSQFANLMAKDAEIAVPVFRSPKNMSRTSNLVRNCESASRRQPAAHCFGWLLRMSPSDEP